KLCNRHKVLPKAGLSSSDWTFVQGSTFVLRLNFCTNNPRLRQYPNRCAKVSAPLQLLHIEARISSAAVSKRFRCRKNLQHICGLAKFPQESKLSEETSPIRASLYAISPKDRQMKEKITIFIFIIFCN